MSFALSGYRFLRVIGFLSGLAAGSGCILWIQKQNITLFGNPTDSGKFLDMINKLIK